MATPQQKPSALDTLLGGLPAAGSDPQQQTALASLLGPGSGPGTPGALSPYLRLGGQQYAEQLDDLMTNPLAVWY